MSLRSTVMHQGRVCSDAELMEPAPHCGICRYDGARRVALTIQRSPAVHLLECPRCGGASASRMPKPETLASYYSQYWSPAATKLTFSNPERLARHIRKLAPDLPSPLRILDFGGGDGTLAALVGQALPPAKAHIDLIDYADSLRDVASRQYDLVLASSVMEHIPDARSDFQRLFAALAPGGYLYARTPWIAPLFAIFERFAAPYDFTYPAHVHDLGRQFWERLIASLDLDPREFVLRHSRPSMVETDFTHAPLRTIAAHFLKSLWWILPRHYTLVGGWEVLFERV